MAAGSGGARVVFFFLLGFLLGIVVVGNRFAILEAYNHKPGSAPVAGQSNSRPAVGVPRDDAVFGPRKNALQLRKRAAGPAAAAGGSSGSASDISGGNPPSTPLRPVASDDQIEAGNVCKGTDRLPKDGVDKHKYRIVKGDEVDAAAYKCWKSELKHWEFEYYHKQPGYPFCTHDPAVDKVISSHLHDYGFWGSPVEFRTMLTFGPCTEERPFMLDIGANIGLFTVMAAWHNCHVFAFEPLAENNHRLLQSLALNKLEDKVRVFKHAVGKKYDSVRLGFRASNPGSSGIGLAGNSEEVVEQITIDSLLAGPMADAWVGEGMPRVEGSKINFVKIDTEGWDVAVFEGAMSTLLKGEVPHILVEFSPGDAKGTAGCDPARFVSALYEAGYTMYEHGKPFSLSAVLDVAIPEGLSGKGKRVWEAWFFKEAAAIKLVEAGQLKQPPSAAANPDAVV